jgi:hypothetical protein
MTHHGSLLTNAKKAVADWGGTVRRSYGDDHGDFAFRFTFREETFIGVSKQAAHQGLASFEQTITRRAAYQDALLVEFFGTDPTLGSAYVYWPETVIKAGEESVGNSKKGIRTEWYQLPLKKGVLLGDFVSGRAEPSKPREETAGMMTINDFA